MNENRKLTIVIEESANGSGVSVAVKGNVNNPMMVHGLGAIIHAFRKTGRFSLLDVFFALANSHRCGGPVR